MCCVGAGVAVGAGVGTGVGDAVGATLGDGWDGLGVGAAVSDATVLASGVGLGVGPGSVPRMPNALPSRNRTTTAAPTPPTASALPLTRDVDDPDTLRRAVSGSSVRRVLPKATSGATRGRPLEAASHAVRAAAKRSHRTWASVRHS